MTDRELDKLVAEKVMGLEPCEGWVEANLGSAGGPVVTTNREPHLWNPKSETRCSHKDRNCYPSMSLNLYNNIPPGGPCPYSTHIARAWEVREKIAELGYGEMLICRGCNGWEAYQATACADPDFGDWFVVSVDTVPKAICLAALEAIKVTAEKYKE